MRPFDRHTLRPVVQVVAYRFVLRRLGNLLIQQDMTDDDLLRRITSTARYMGEGAAHCVPVRHVSQLFSPRAEELRDPNGSITV
jgi:hypothetical protein